MLLTRLTCLLDSKKIPYALIGGYAVALHGAVRGTVDIDLVIQFDERDFIRTEAILHELGLESRLPIGGTQVFKFRKEYLENRNLIAWNFYNPQKPSEQVDIILTQDLREIQVVTLSFRSMKLKVASIPDLIKMKEAAGRPQDLADVESLRELLRMRKAK